MSDPQCTRVGLSRPSSYGFTFEIQAPERAHVFVSQLNNVAMDDVMVALTRLSRALRRGTSGKKQSQI